MIRFFEARGVEHAFTVCGGGSIFLNDALAKARRMKYIACHHEQAAGMAAEAYARVRNGLGLCIVTSGPGGTNAVTAAAGCWTDSVPVVFISGQVFSSQTIGKRSLRTLGVQEISIVDVVRPITKRAVMVRSPLSIAHELELAVTTARDGRPGPVWLDIPADVQNAEINLGELEPGEPFGHRPALDEQQVDEVARLLAVAKRPLLHVGQGVRIAGAEDELLKLLHETKVPVVTARNANDLIASDHPQFVGRPGTFAQRGANFAVQTCDLYVAVGTRLGLAQTGYNARDYARRAKKVMVDVDQAELEKGTVLLDLKIRADAGAFLRELLRRLPRFLPDWSCWLARCKAWQEKYPAVTNEQRSQAAGVNSYHLVDELSEQLGPQDVVVTDMGFAFQCTHQAFRLKTGQRLFTNGGLAAMGWGLPAAIGAAFGSGRRVVCIAGDGGLMFNVQELATLARHRLPVKLFVLNNGGYLTMRQSQAHAFKGYMGSDEDSGLSFPNFRWLARSFGVTLRYVEHSSMVREVVRDALAEPGPVFCEVMMDRDQSLIPKSINRREADGTIRQTAMEDAWPYLDRAELEENLRV